MSKMYSFGYGPTAISALERRTVQNEADVFLKYLNSSMKLLDVGSGPGNLSIGFAKQLTRGQVYGVDIAASQVELATQKCQEAQINNCQFQLGSIECLPFEDETFDAVWCSNILLNFNKHTQIRDELKRVLKPKGVIGLLEQHADGYLIYPKDSAIDMFFQVLTYSVTFNGGDPNVGKLLPHLFSQNGFDIIEVDNCSKIINTLEERLKQANLFAGLWEETAFPDLAVKQKWITEQQRKTLANQIRAEANHKDNFSARTVIKVVARKE